MWEEIVLKERRQRALKIHTYRTHVKCKECGKIILSIRSIKRHTKLVYKPEKTEESRSESKNCGNVKQIKDVKIYPLN